MSFCGILLGSSAQGQVVTPLNFNNPVGTADGSYTLGPYFSGKSLNFLNVANVGGISVDMKATVSNVSSNTTFQGHFADYSQNTPQPNGDLGTRYIANAYGVGGFDYTLEFFANGSNFSTALAIPEFELLIYDVDGELDQQSEMFRAYDADGLQSYRLADSPDSVTAQSFSGGFLFTGPGYNMSETDTSAAVLLNYRNTNKLTLRFETDTYASDFPNGVFQAIDGDMSILNGDTSSFDPAVPVPEPSVTILAAVAAMLFSLRRRRCGA